VREVGAPGVVNGVTVAEVAEYVPLPTMFRAAIRKMYPTPFVKPVAVNDVTVDPVFADAVIHEVPPLLEYSIA
jgi:hypothetical protein